uniref:Uncharacterized protein n=1 Tax=Arundo donax TaxID=35708 RepID=A0A0A9CLI9_ARUDO
MQCRNQCSLMRDRMCPWLPEPCMHACICLLAFRPHGNELANARMTRREWMHACIVLLVLCRHGVRI